MGECKPLYSEEDVRTKIVTVWLADHGFGPSDISVEYSFAIHLGRKITSIDSERLKIRDLLPIPTLLGSGDLSRIQQIKKQISYFAAIRYQLPVPFNNFAIHREGN